MMNIDLPEDSDTSDEDYNPGEKQEEVVSEIESDDPISDTEDLKGKTKSRKKGRKATKRAKKKEKDTKELDSDKNAQEQLQAAKPEDKKKQEDDLWADFMKDTGFRSKNSQRPPVNSSISKSTSHSSDSSDNKLTEKKLSMHKPAEKVKITQIFEFAGEEVQVEKEVPVDSAEARLLAQTSDNGIPNTSKGKRSGGLSGIDNVLNQLSKKPKISTLEKTKMDWDKFKKEENIEEELQNYNKGKDGYLDRQDFLQRADLRRFEIEREIRTIERNKRFNSTL